MKGPVKIVFVDEEHAMRFGMEAFFKNYSDAYELETISDPIDVIDKKFNIEPELFILDLKMPRNSIEGLELAKQLKHKYPRAKFLAFTATDPKVNVLKESCFNGFHHKLNGDLDSLLETIEKVLKSNSFVYDKNDYEFNHESKAEDDQTEFDWSPKFKNPLGLTKRELEIIRMRVNEKTENEIAKELHISYSTVKKHSSNFFKKIKAKKWTNVEKYIKKLNKGLDS